MIPPAGTGRSSGSARLDPVFAKNGRRRARWPGVALLCVTSAVSWPTGAAEHAGESAAELTRYKALLAGAAEKLETSLDPDALAAAALLRWRTDTDAALALLERASRTRLSPPGLTWLHATLCGAASACDPAPLEARFREQDPGNALGWLAEIHRAYATGNGAALEAALARAAALPVVNIHFTSNVGRLAGAVDRAGSLPPAEALATVAGELAATPALVQLTAVSRVCDEKALARSLRREQCRALARSMLAGDTVLGESLGVAIAKRAWPEDSVEWATAAEVRRVQRYRMKWLVGLDAELERDPRAARDVIALFKLLPREQEVLVARLEARGIDPMPPAGWREPAPP